MKYTKEDLLDFNIIQNLQDMDSDGSNSFLKEIIDLYKSQYPELIRNISDAILNNDPPALAKASHTLKGASLNIGAREIADLSKKMEMNAKENMMIDMQKILNDISLSFVYFPQK